MKLLRSALLLLGAVLYCLHFKHLRADFPNFSPWMDWAKYTDEGWYGDAAIRFYLRGTWHLPGDFNPGAALPVWPLLEALVFRFTGVGIVAARALAVALFGGIIISGYHLVRAVLPFGALSKEVREVFAAAAAVLLAASSFLFAFSRMAILEPLLVLWLLLALLLASTLRGGMKGARRYLALVGVGLLTALMIGTKTTAMFLLPSICCMLWAGAGKNLRRSILDTSVAACAALLPAALYYLLLRRGGYLQDVRYLFTANAYTAITPQTFWSIVWQAVSDGLWIGPLLFFAALFALFAAGMSRRAWTDPVFSSLVLWVVGYLAYIAYHANLQPRYYFVVAVPLVLLLGRSAMHLQVSFRQAPLLLAPLALVLLATEAFHTLHYVRHPEYSYQEAALKVGRIVESQPAHSHTVLSISGSNLSLMTGLPSICDDFGTLDLEDRIAVYKPGWFVTWNYVEDDKMQALSRFYQLTRIAALPAMDDPERNLMIVYRLDAKDGVAPRRRKPNRMVGAPPKQSTRI